MGRVARGAICVKLIDLRHGYNRTPATEPGEEEWRIGQRGVFTTTTRDVWWW
jgi:hypothetical protein